MRVLGGLYLAVLILLLSIGVGLYVDLKSNQTHEQNRQIQVGLERMVRLNQSLTHLIGTAVIEKNSLRAASYPSVRAELEATMQAVQALSAHMVLASEISALRDEQHALRRQESLALDLMRSDQWPAAHQAMLVGDYVMAVKIYEINSEAAVGALTIELANTARQQGQLRQATLALRLAAMALLLWAGWRYSRRLQADLAEQRHLRAEVSDAKRVLEEKVHQRTAELEDANRQLETLSTTDALTGLANRRRFEKYWAEEWQRAMRQGTPLAVIMIDVDHFKNYNDHYGHQIGDDCLRRLGAVLRAAVRRAGELAARYGGEEFVVVLPGANAQQAVEAAAVILSAIQAEQIPHANSPVAPVLTLSLGVAAGSPGPGEDRDRLIRLADQALYQAKDLGRNRVVLADAT
jgi:diguanylate cyclase (GGDEF)-like protein